MSLDHLLSSIDQEISRLQQARALLAGGNAGKRTGTSRSGGATAPKKSGPKRTLSAEARKRIAEAQRKRWAAQRKVDKVK